MCYLQGQYLLSLISQPHMHTQQCVFDSHIESVLFTPLLFLHGPAYCLPGQLADARDSTWQLTLAGCLLAGWPALKPPAAAPVAVAAGRLTLRWSQLRSERPEFEMSLDSRGVFTAAHWVLCFQPLAQWSKNKKRTDLKDFVSCVAPGIVTWICNVFVQSEISVTKRSKCTYL